MSPASSKRTRDHGARMGAARTDIEVLAARLGVPIGDDDLRHALTHRSYAYENGGIPHNERLEVLGDSVLGLVVTDTLFRRHTDLPESQLAKFRAAVVNAKACARIAADLEVGDFMLLGRGEQSTGGRTKTSILADAMEAIIGVVHLRLGLQAATDLVHRLFDPVMIESAEMGAGLDWKTSLQELCANLGLRAPEYVIDSAGPDHAKEFVACVELAGIRYEQGAGTSKKDAEQLAAKAAYEALSGGNASAGRPGNAAPAGDSGRPASA
jgi:ribonuclease-3